MVSLAIGGPVAAILVSQQKAIAERNAELARDAQHKAEQSAELARQERERAIAAQRVAETNEQKAVAAQKEADQNARSAAEQRGLALEALSTLVTKVQNQLRETPATQKLKQDLLGTGLDGLRKVAKSAQTSRITDGMMAEAHQRMGDIFQSLGQYAEAREQYEASHEIRQAIAGAAPQHLESQRLLALSFSKLGDIRYLEGNASLARQHYEACLRLRETLAAEHGRNAPLLVDLATSYTMLAGVSEPDEAEKYYRQALEIRQALAAQAPEATRANRERDVWILYNRLAALCQKRNELAQAESYYEQALAQARKLADLLPTSIRAKIDLATSQASVALIQNQAGRTAEAREHFGQAIALLAPLAAEDPRNLELQTYYALFLARHGDVVQAAARAEQLRALAPQNHLNLYNVACCYALCAAAVKQAPPAGDSAAAPSEDYAGRAIRTLREAATRGLNGTAGIEGDHDLDAIRDHPEYPALLEALK
jgi:tetratricopeptide (TPR) repeat protein